MTSTIRPTIDDMAPVFQAAGGWVEPHRDKSHIGTVPVIDEIGSLPVEVTFQTHRATGRVNVYAWAGTTTVVVPLPPASAARAGETPAECWLREACETAVAVAAEHVQRLIAIDLEQYADPARLGWARHGILPEPTLDGYAIRACPIWPGGAEGYDRPAVDVNACYPAPAGLPVSADPVWTSYSGQRLPRQQRLVDAITRTIADRTTADHQDNPWGQLISGLS